MSKLSKPKSLKLPKSDENPGFEAISNYFHAAGQTEQFTNSPLDQNDKHVIIVLSDAVMSNKTFMLNTSACI